LFTAVPHVAFALPLPHVPVLVCRYTLAVRLRLHVWLRVILPFGLGCLVTHPIRTPAWFGLRVAGSCLTFTVAVTFTLRGSVAGSHAVAACCVPGLPRTRTVAAQLQFYVANAGSRLHRALVSTPHVCSHTVRFGCSYAPAVAFALRFQLHVLRTVAFALRAHAHLVYGLTLRALRARLVRGCTRVTLLFYVLFAFVALRLFLVHVCVVVALRLPHVVAAFSVYVDSFTHTGCCGCLHALHTVYAFTHAFTTTPVTLLRYVVAARCCVTFGCVYVCRVAYALCAFVVYTCPFCCVCRLRCRFAPRYAFRTRSFWLPFTRLPVTFARSGVFVRLVYPRYAHGRTRLRLRARTTTFRLIAVRT